MAGKKKPKREKGINVLVSLKAHAKMQSDGNKAKPRRNLREQVNFINGLPITL